MRKSSLVKAMACFMAATMAITCVPSANVTNGISVVAEAEEVFITESNANEVTIDDTAGWWTNFSSKYQVSGDFDVQFVMDSTTTATGNHNVPCTFISHEDVSNIAVLRPDIASGNMTTWWGKTTTGGNTIAEETNIDWDSWVATISDCTITERITRTGDDFVCTKIIAGKNGKTYTTKFSFTEANATDKINFEFMGDTCKFTIKSFTNFADYVDNANLPAGVELIDGVYEISSKVDWVTEKSGKYEVDLTKIFKGELESEKTTVAPATEKNIEVTVNGNTQSFKIKVLEDNKCKSINVTEGNNTSIVLGNSFDIKATAVGEKENATVTEAVTCSAIDADVVEKSKNGNEYVFTVTPKTATTGAIATVYSEETGKKAEVSYSVIGNKAKSLTSLYGTEFTVPANRYVAFTIEAEAENPAYPLQDAIELKSVTTAAITVDGKLKDSFDVEYSAANKSAVVKGKIESGKYTFVFKCGDAELTVNVIGSSTATTVTPGTSTDTNKPAEDTNKPAEDTNKPAEDTNKPAEDTNKPAEDTNKPAEDTNKPEDDKNNATTTTKKKVKITSATAKKGKKAVTVSGKVTKKATVKVTAAKKTLKTTANKNGKFSVKFSQKISKKIKKKAKVKIVVTKSGYKKATKTIKVK